MGREAEDRRKTSRASSKVKGRGTNDGSSVFKLKKLEHFVGFGNLPRGKAIRL